MSLGTYFFKKCADNIRENLALIQMKLSDPGNLVTFELSGKLVDAAKGGLGPLSAFAGDYIQQNSATILVQALRATGLEDTAQQAFNLANNMLAASIMANNELVMYFVRRLAGNCISLLKEKQALLTELSARVTELYNLLKILDQGNPVYDPYIAQLRRALTQVRSARTDLVLVRNTFVRRDLWLSRRFATAKTSLENAKNLVTPPTPSASVNKSVAGGAVNKGALSSAVNNPLANGTTGPSGIDFTKAVQIAAIGLFENPPVPTTAEQYQATISIPKVSKQVIEASQGYFEMVSRINGLIAAFLSALSQLNTGLPAYYKKYILSLFDPLVSGVDSVAGEMANILNGSPTAFAGPLGGFKPQPLTASVNAFKWGMELSIILENFKTIPAGALNSLAIGQKTLEAYQTAVRSLQKLDDIKMEGVIFRATDAQEETGALESQLLIFLLEATNAPVSASVRTEVLGVARAVLKRLAITVSRDNQIADALQKFVSTPFELEDVIKKIGEGLFALLASAGLDNAQDLLESGEFTKFFKLNSKEATFVGAALAAVALLKQCFPDQANRDKLSQVEFELEKDADLLSIQFSIDFDLAILKNLRECLQFNSLGGSFSLQEAFCGIIAGGGVGQSLNKLKDVLSF